MLSQIGWYVQLGLILAASIAVWKRYRSTGDAGYVAIAGVIVLVPLCLALAKMWTWLWFARRYGPFHSFEGLAHGFDEAMVPLTALGVVVALYAVDRKPGSENLWKWLWSEDTKRVPSKELAH